jgi:hypothetical protein
VIFTAVIATFFILMAFQINKTVALAKRFIGNDQKNAPDKEAKGTITEDATNSKSRRVWNNAQGEDESQQKQVSLV